MILELQGKNGFYLFCGKIHHCKGVVFLEADKDSSPALEEAYLGFKIFDVKVFMGKTDSASDEFGVAGTYETLIADDCFDEFGNVDGDDLIGVSAKIGEYIDVLATYEMEADSDSDDNGTFYDIFVGANFQGLSLGVAYQNFKGVGSSIDENIYGIQIIL